MLAMEEVLCELSDHEKRNEQQGLPPGFRFHPTDEELITFYLASKVFNGSFTTTVKFAEVDLNRCEPWELPEVAKMGEREWYLFSLRDRKYPTGLRTNRATGAGYWKATGKDKEVYSGTLLVVGMKKTLVFYKGRAPRGEKTKWVMHEYRLDGHFSLPHSHTSVKEEWVICRIFHKSGEKRTPLLQVQGHNSSDPLLSSPTCFTLELESQSQLTPVLINHHQDQNDLSHPHIFSLPKEISNARNHPTFSDLFFKPGGLQLQQNCTQKTNKDQNHQTIPKLVTKTEDSTSFYNEYQYHYHQLLDDDPNNNMRWVNKLNHEVDAAANAQVRDMSTSTPFHRIGLLHQVLDSCPLPQRV